MHGVGIGRQKMKNYQIGIENEFIDDLLFWLGIAIVCGYTIRKSWFNKNVHVMYVQHLVDNKLHIM